MIDTNEMSDRHSPTVFFLEKKPMEKEKVSTKQNYLLSFNLLKRVRVYIYGISRIIIIVVRNICFEPL